ncbi:hypothetical protein HYSC106933_11850 [Hydrogenibacillus schlegelii]
MPRIEPFETHGEVYDDWFERYKGIYVSELKAVRLLLPSFQRGGRGRHRHRALCRPFGDSGRGRAFS